MQVEMVYRNGQWLTTGNVADEVPLDGCVVMHAISVQMTGWVRRLWIPSPIAGELTLADGVIGWAEALPIDWRDRPHGVRCAEIGSFISFCAGPSVFAVFEGEASLGEALLVKQAVMAAEKVLAADDETLIAGGCMNAAQAKGEIAEFMKRGFKLEVQHPLRVKGERQYLMLPLTGKKGVATWNIAISPRKNDTSSGR